MTFPNCSFDISNLLLIAIISHLVLKLEWSTRRQTYVDLHQYVDVGLIIIFVNFADQNTYLSDN